MTDDGGTGGAVCPRCRRWRDADDFRTREGHSSKACGPCLDAARAGHRARRERIGAEGVRADNLRAKYGITAEQYDALRHEQGYRCAICGRHEDDLPRGTSGRPRLDGRPTAEPFKLVVDHCHDSRRVRGLLCVGCNAGIGHFRHDPAVLRAALTYLSSRDTP